jgi:hypothetical protein
VGWVRRVRRIHTGRHAHGEDVPPGGNEVDDSGSEEHGLVVGMRGQHEDGGLFEPLGQGDGDALVGAGHEELEARDAAGEQRRQEEEGTGGRAARGRGAERAREGLSPATGGRIGRRGLGRVELVRDRVVFELARGGGRGAGDAEVGDGDVQRAGDDWG